MHFDCESAGFVNGLYIGYQKKKSISEIISNSNILYFLFLPFVIFLMFQISRYHDVEINEVLHICSFGLILLVVLS